MAEMRIRRKSGGAWWLWLLLLVLLLALIWWLVTALSDRHDDRIAGAEGLEEPVAASSAAGARSVEGATAGEPITELAAITGAADAGALAGRPVRLSGARVDRMIGDATFWIGSGQDRVLVILDQVIPSEPRTVEGRVNVNSGQSVDIQGRLRAAADAPPEGVLSAEDQRQLADRQVYVWADAVQVATPASAAPHGPPGLTPDQQRR